LLAAALSATHVAAGLLKEVLPDRKPPSPTAARRRVCTKFVRQLGPSIRGGTREEAAAKDIVFVAVPWTRRPRGSRGPTEFRGAQSCWTLNNPLQKPPLPLLDVCGRASTAVETEMVPVRAWSRLSITLRSEPRRRACEGRRPAHPFYASDDAWAKAEIAAMIERLGPLDVGMGHIKPGSRLHVALTQQERRRNPRAENLMPLNQLYGFPGALHDAW
jgi:predicted dinucleotide-binding enzyme